MKKCFKDWSQSSHEEKIVTEEHFPWHDFKMMFFGLDLDDLRIEWLIVLKMSPILRNDYSIKFVLSRSPWVIVCFGVKYLDNGRVHDFAHK